ncbi:uncharacterized protein [Porites lutea]|uniref:uncharacterized protein n=1 Tax=Porites lutea TaxID=51062 RepID=UPI003CC59060
MPSCRCVVQDCSNRSNPKLGISLHKPKTSFESQKWKAFVRTHRANFNPKGLFKICSVHFTADCFERAVHVPGTPRVTLAGAIPTICKLGEAGNSSAMSARDRRMAMKHILAVHEASNVATSQELEEDEEFDSPASGESAVQLEREPDSNEIEEMEEEVEEYAVTDPLSSSNSMQVEQTTETTPIEGSVHADMDTSNSLCSSSSMDHVSSQFLPAAASTPITPTAHENQGECSTCQDLSTENKELKKEIKVLRFKVTRLTNKLTTKSSGWRLCRRST